VKKYGCSLLTSFDYSNNSFQFLNPFESKYFDLMDSSKAYQSALCIS